MREKSSILHKVAEDQMESLQERTVRAMTACKIALVLRHFIIISKAETSSEFIQNQSKC